MGDAETRQLNHCAGLHQPYQRETEMSVFNTDENYWNILKFLERPASEGIRRIAFFVEKPFHPSARHPHP